MLLALFVIALSAYSTQASFSKGNCLEIPTIASIDFDRVSNYEFRLLYQVQFYHFYLNQYIGDWYEIERFSSWFESSLKCGKAEYAKIDSSSISVRNSGVNKKTGALTSIDGHASVISADAQNKLSLQLPIVVSGITVYKNNGLYNIWETDYDNYALIYSCRQIRKLY